MKLVSAMTQIELAAYVQTGLAAQNIRVTLSAYYCQNRYVSFDIDLVNEYFINRSRIEKAMQSIGFSEVGRYFVHPDSTFGVEFPPGPLTVGVEPVKKVEDYELETGILHIISATDCVKDRLAAFYHWGDEQCLFQARLVKQHAFVDLVEIERWSVNEGKKNEFLRFLADD